MKVIKRDGTPQEYNFMKIVDAVTKAFNSILVVDKSLDEDEYLAELKKLKEKQQPEISKFLDQLKESIEKLIIKNNGNGTEIEEIQDCIQKELIKRNKYEVVEAFINYRRKREEIREQKSDLMKQITEKLNASNVQNQNANLDEASFGGRLGEAAGIVSKNAALKHMSKMARKNHEGNMVYVHDLDHYEIGDHNCLSIPFDRLLENGFKTRQTDVRPAGSVNTAMQLIAVIFQLQSLQQFGGVGATHIDWTMVPYVRKSFIKHFKDGLKYVERNSEQEIDLIISNLLGLDKIEDIEITDSRYKKYSKVWNYAYKMTEKEIHQAVEGMYHNLNTLQSRSGNQLPFTSINYGTCTLEAGRMVTKALLEVSMEGLGKNGVTSIFPCGIFQYKKGVNDKPGTPNYDLKRLALKSTSMRIYPNYANADWTNNANALKQDRKQKQEYIDNLSKSDYAKLVEVLEKNPNVAYKLGLELE